jgi:hypothetical protein
MRGAAGEAEVLASPRPRPGAEGDAGPRCRRGGRARGRLTGDLSWPSRRVVTR